MIRTIEHTFRKYLIPPTSSGYHMSCTPRLQAPRSPRSITVEIGQASRTPHRHFEHVHRTSQTLALSSHERQHPIGFFSLPAEIRNVIMRFVLVPDEIQLHAPEPDGNSEERGLLRGVIGRVYEHLSRGEDMKSSSTLQPPGFPAPCRLQTGLRRGSKKAFYLPWGAVENICRCFLRNPCGT